MGKMIYLKNMNDRKKVLQVITSCAIGGLCIKLYSVITKLKNDFDIVVACPNDGPYFEKYRQLGVAVYDVPLRSITINNIFQLAKIIKKERVGVIHSHGKGAGLWARPAGLITGTAVFHSPCGIHYEKYNFAVKNAYIAAEIILGKMTTKMINVSNGERNECLRLRFCNSRRSLTIYNGIDLRDNEALRSKEAAASIRDKLGLCAGQILIASVGRMSAEKGYEYLLRSIPLVLREYKDAKFILVGDGDKKKELEKLAENLRIEDKVIFTGFRNDALDILSAADIYVSSSLKEGLPNTLLEAMACKKPIVATDVIGNNEVVVNGEVGFLVPAKDPAEMANRIIELINNEDLRKKFADNELKILKNKFSQEVMVNKLANAYNEVLNAK